MCCARLATNTGCKNDAKNRHLGTIPQLCWAISSQLRHVSTIGKKLVKQQYLHHISLQYGELTAHQRLRSFRQFGAPELISTGFASWHRYCTASSSERQPNFEALNRGHHLCSAGRPSCWALAHILVCYLTQTFLVFISHVCDSTAMAQVTLIRRPATDFP